MSLDRRWCDSCGAEREGYHVHGDPLELLTWEELLEKARAAEARLQNPSATDAQ